MARVRVSTTVDEQLLASARRARAGLAIKPAGRVSTMSIGDRGAIIVEVLAVRDGSATPPCRRHARNAARWLVTACAVGVAGYVAVPPAAYLLWVATSAFFGIRDEPDYGLGAVCTIAAVAPFVAGIGAYLVKPGARSRRRGVARGALTCAAVGVLSMAVALMLMGPF